MPRSGQPVDLAEAAVHALATSNQVDVFLVEHLSDELWSSVPPGGRKTIGAIVTHIHNVRCMWVTMLGRKLGIEVPAHLGRAGVTREQALVALRESQAALSRLLEHGLASGGKVAGFPPDVMHFLAYFVAHDAHHRGQICMLARQLGHRLPPDVTAGLWQWSARAKEAGG